MYVFYYEKCSNKQFLTIFGLFFFFELMVMETEKVLGNIEGVCG